MKRVLITGANSGIGKELALLLAERGVELILHGRDPVSLLNVYNQVSQKTKAKLCKADLSSFDGLQTVLTVLQKDFPDTVINNAGFGLYGDLISHGPQETQEMIAANCASIVTISQHIAYWWKEQGMKGTILNVSSALSFLPSPGAAVYGATKAFVTSFSQALDVEMQPNGIRVLCACPGRVATHFATRASKGRKNTQEPGGMLLDPKEVAAAMIKQIEKKKPLQIIDWKYKLLIFMRKLLPTRWAMKGLYLTLKRRAG